MTAFRFPILLTIGLARGVGACAAHAFFDLLFFLGFHAGTGTLTFETIVLAVGESSKNIEIISSRKLIFLTSTLETRIVEISLVTTE
jgi:hypothetical protein